MVKSFADPSAHAVSRPISGVLPAKIEFSNFLKVKSELCSPHSFFQFKHVLSKEKVVYL
jgi:hypothetical protein